MDDDEIFNIIRVASSWEEDTLTWNNQPSGNGSTISSVTIPSTDKYNSYWVNWTVTETIKSMTNGTYTNHGFIINNSDESDPNSTCEFSSAEGSNVPYLEITYTETTPPTYSNIITSGTNKTNTTVTFNTTWSDDFELHGWLFEHNQSGTFVNSTFNTTWGSNDESTYNLNITLTRGQQFDWRFHANDTSGNINQTGLQTFTIVNTEPPQVTSWTTPSATPHYSNNNITFNWTAVTDVDGDTVYYQFYINLTLAEYQLVYNDTVSNWTSNLTQDGNYNYIVGTYDGYDYGINSSARVFVYDTTAPTVDSLDDLVNNSNLSSSTVQFNFTGTDTNPSNAILYINGVANETLSSWTSGTKNSFSAITMADGYYNWTVWVNDSAGNEDWFEHNYTLTVDTVAPVISYSGGTTNASNYYSQNWIYVNVSVVESNFKNITFYLYNLTDLVNETPYTTATYSINFTSLLDTNYSINATIYDTAGNKNSTPTRNGIGLDTAPPSFSNNQTNSTSSNPKINQDIQINLTISDAIGLSSYIFSWNDSGSWANDSTVLISGTSHNITINKTVTSQLHPTIGWKVYANDTLGNQNESQAYSFQIVNTQPTLKTDLRFTNASVGHWFNVSFEVTDADNASDIISTTIESSSGTCTAYQNSTSGNDFKIQYNCTGTALQQTIIRINATDLGGATINSSQIPNTYPNNVPSVASASINNTSPIVSDDLECLNGSVSDTDGDAVTLIYDWVKNDAVQSINSKILGSGNTTAGETWKCLIIPTDTYANGSTKTSASVSIGTGFLAPTINWTNATTENTNTASTSTNPTNNNSWINLSVYFDDGNAGELHTAYFCTSDSATASGCSVSTYCNSSINSSNSPYLSCEYNVSGLTSTTYTYYVFVADNTSLISSSTSNTFTLNFPPTTPTTTNNTYLNYNWNLINFSSTDSDGDLINYTIYANETITTLNQLYTGNLSYFNWTGLADGVYYTLAFTTDEHDYSNNINSSIYTFTIDTIKPNLTVTSPTATTYNTQTVSLILSASDTNLGSCYYNLYYNDTGSLKQSNSSVNCTETTTLSTPYYAGGYKLDVFVNDSAGNLNSTQIIFTTETVSETITTGGGGGTTIVEEKIIEERLKEVEKCGDGVCDDTENPLDCPQDCRVFSLDEMFCTPMFACGNWTRAWFVNSMMVIVVMGIVYQQYRSRKVRRPA